ncbi:MAG: PEP-CTERM sorting domain-containing protein [Sedimentisphaerales bacterium]|nr:PEP-CTERM sorting domain-containing protein [Sedimentisphaerales bacterium]
MSTCKNKAICTVWFFVICVVLIAGSSNAQVDYVLMLQQTPAKGGTVSPDIGVHNISANDTVIITATPKQGYQFVYWLGDVANPTASTTVVSVNSPKIVMAIFELNAYESPFESELLATDGGGGGGGDSLIQNRNGQVVGGGGGISPASGSANVYRQSGTGNDDGDNGDPVPVPEPATIALFAVGMMVIFGLYTRKVTQ